jgi:predicted RNA-binding protein YlqC (UPF0109 family)
MTSGVAPAPESSSNGNNKTKPVRKQASRSSDYSNSNSNSNISGSKNTPNDDNTNLDPTQASIAQHLQGLAQPQITITCYIPTQSVGAVIGRRGSTIAQIQRHAQQVGGGTSVRLSIVGHETEETLPYTYSELDWSSPHWTPVVIRADPLGALSAAEQLQAVLVDDKRFDQVVVDLPISRTKHAAIIGKKGLVLAHLSADYNVRIMVPRRELRHDVIQLEGDYENCKVCLEKLLILAQDARPCTKPSSTAFNISQLPSQTKLRSVGRKTDTVIKKKKVEDEWQLTVTGATDQVQIAVTMLQKWAEDSTANNNNNTGGGAAAGTAANSSTGEMSSSANSNVTPRGPGTSNNKGGRGGGGRGGGGRGRGRGDKNGKKPGRGAVAAAAQNSASSLNSDPVS